MTTSDAFPADRVARGTAIKTEYEQATSNNPKGRPVKFFVHGLPESAKSVVSEPYDFVSLADTATKYGYGSTLYQVCKRLRPANAVGVGAPITLLPLAVTTGVTAVGDITPVGTCTKAETYTIKVSNKHSLDIVMAIGETVADFVTKGIAAMNGVLDMQLLASDGTGKITGTSKVYTDAGDFYHIEVTGPTDADLSFTIVQPTGGGGSVDYSTVWAVYNDTWYSHHLNGNGDATDSTFLNSAQAFGELRWSPEVKKPVKIYTGTNESTLATVTTITDARKSDRVNSIKHSPGSNDTPWDIVGRMLAIQGIEAIADPAQDYQLRACSGLTPGPASVQLDSTARDGAVKKGLSTIELTDSGTVVSISDSVMCYHPDGEDPPGFRFDVDIEKECAMLYNIDLIFTNPADAGNPLIPDGQATTNSNARKPSYFKRKLSTLFENQALAAVISDPDYAKENTTVTIVDSRRLDVVAVYKLSGNLGVISVTNKFTFYTGGAA